MAVRGRAYWKGSLRLSLVSIAVEVHNAVDTAKEIHFNQIHKPTGKRVNHIKSVQGVGPIENYDIVKGYEIEKDQYVILEPSEIDAIRLESKKTLDLTQFVAKEDIDARYFERPYYIVPQDAQAAEGYVVIREALKKMNRLGVGQVTMSGREYLVSVGPVGKGLVMEIMRYGKELRSEETYFGDLPNLKIDPEMISIATEIIKRKSKVFDPDEFQDHFAVALAELVKVKSEGKRIVTAQEPGPPRTNVVNLMDALRKSLQSEKPAAEGKPKLKKKAARV